MGNEEDSLSRKSESGEDGYVENTPPPAPDFNKEIPNGGLTAWLQVLGSFFLFFNSWGIVNTFGVYQTYYMSSLGETPSNISWIGSIQAYLLLLIGVATGPLYDAGYFRHLLFTGSFLVVFGLMMTSISSVYWQVMLAQAVCIGFGCGCLFVPSVAILSTYFSTKKAFVTGIAASGSSLGGVIYPIVFHKLEPQVGFGWATRILAFIMLATLSISLAVMKMRVVPAQKRKLWDIAAFKDKPYLFFTIGVFFAFMGLYTPFFYVQSYVIEEGIMNVNTAFYMLSVLNAASIFGRIIPGLVADKVGPFNIVIPGTIAACVLAFGWIGIHSVAGIIVFCILYGFFSGCFVSIPPTVIVTLCPHPSVIGTRMGMCFALGGLGLLCGTPVAGQLINQYNFISGIAFSAVAIALGVVCMVAARISKTGLTFKVIA